jgi:hypothetical protein
VQWVLLQYDECDAELAALRDQLGVQLHRWPGVDLKQDLESVVGLMAGLDAVVTAPTAVSSLAGAVGTQCWQVDNGSDWTTLGGSLSPWFPRLEVVSKLGPEESWDGVLTRVSAKLATWLAEASR